MNVSIERKKEEAIKRMKAWEIFPGTVKQFERDNKLSESQPPMGACFWVEGEQLKRVKEFEKEHDALVYFIIHSYTNMGEMESYLYVSDEEEEWEYDWEDLRNGTQLVYVYNRDIPEFSEFGSIGIRRTTAAGLKRVMACY